VFEDEVEFQRLDGSRIWVLLSGKAVSRDLSQGVVWVMRDVTGRRRLQQQLDMAMPEGF
jgi:PAS domain S-box-containing protein